METFYFITEGYHFCCTSSVDNVVVMTSLGSSFFKQFISFLTFCLLQKSREHLRSEQYSTRTIRELEEETTNDSSLISFTDSSSTFKRFKNCLCGCCRTSAGKGRDDVPSVFYIHHTDETLIT